MLLNGKFHLKIKNSVCFLVKKKMRAMNIIRSENHDIYSKKVNKIALSDDDDKRQVLEDKIHTLALR